MPLGIFLQPPAWESTDDEKIQFSRGINDLPPETWFVLRYSFKKFIWSRAKISSRNFFWCSQSESTRLYRWWEHLIGF
jgi:hypothetical protein